MLLPSYWIKKKKYPCNAGYWNLCSQAKQWKHRFSKPAIFFSEVKLGFLKDEDTLKAIVRIIMQKYPFSFLLYSSVTGTSLSLKLFFYHFATFHTPQRKQRLLCITWVTGQSSKQVKAQKVHFHGAEENSSPKHHSRNSPRLFLHIHRGILGKACGWWHCWARGRIETPPLLPPGTHHLRCSPADTARGRPCERYRREKGSNDSAHNCLSQRANQLPNLTVPAQDPMIEPRNINLC